MKTSAFSRKASEGRRSWTEKTARDGEKPINTSGGLKAKGHLIGATGISQIYEIATRLRHEAGERQVRKADIGLTNNLGGSAATCLVGRTGANTKGRPVCKFMR